MVIDLIAFVIILLAIPTLTYLGKYRLYGIKAEYFKRIKIKKFHFLFSGIGGKDSIYGDVKNYGIIVPLFYVQLQGYILFVIMLIVAPIMYFAAGLVFATKIMCGITLLCHALVVLAVEIICEKVSKKRENAAKMEQNFCVGICPYCDGNGLLLVVKDELTDEFHACCDECYAEFNCPENVRLRKSHLSKDFNNIPVSLSEAINSQWKDYVYILAEKGKWVKYTDKSKTLW